MNNDDLISRSELLKIFERLKNQKTETAESFTNAGLCKSIEIDRAIDYIENAPTLPQAGEWISVKDRLPEDDYPVIVFTKDLTVLLPIRMGYYENKENEWHDAAEGYYIPVSYWMPLPEQPQEGESK